MNYKLTLQYDGTKYQGWQKQGNTENTIQGKLEGILERMYARPVEIHGSGRTDAGVHALGQIANFHEGSSYTCDQIQKNLNEYLPKDIRVIQAEEVQERFHARLTAVGKIYEYHIDNGKVADPFTRKYAMREENPLDLEAMKKAAGFLVGSHDFKSFCANKRIKKSTQRTLYEISIEEQNGKIKIRYYGNGFLYHMVRILTGTLIQVGRGDITPEQIPDMIQAKERGAAGFTAPAQGLFLVKVFY